MQKLEELTETFTADGLCRITILRKLRKDLQQSIYLDCLLWIAQMKERPNTRL